MSSTGRLARGVAIAAMLLAGSGCERTRQTETSQDTIRKEGITMSQLVVASDAFGQDQTIPAKYTGDGQDVSPPLSFSGIPDGAKELALIMDDPAAPTPKPWVHWVLYKIPAGTTSVPEAVPTSAQVSSLGGALQGSSSWDKIGYGGPAPPRGHGVHDYHFKVYAIDVALSLEAGATKEQLLAAMKGHVLAEGELVGMYER